MTNDAGANREDIAPASRPRPAFSPEAKGGSAQLGEEWDGTAPVPDPLGLVGAADIREFQVLSGFDNDLLTVTITWDPGPALSYDLDLFVERRTDSGAWVSGAPPTGSSSATVRRRRSPMCRRRPPARTAPAS